MQTKEELIQRGRNIREDMDFTDLANEGSKREQLCYLWCFKDKSKNNSIVGFNLLARESVTYMTYKLKPDFKNLLDCEETGLTTVEKGNTFVITLMELLQLITRVEYAGKIAGLFDDSWLRLACKPVKEKTGRVYMFPTFIGEGFKLSDKEVYIQDEDGNILPELEEKFGVISTREDKVAEINDEEARDIAAAFRVQYSNNGLPNNVL